MESSPKVDLSQQVAVVTGGGRGLGRAYCLALAAAGASLAVVARSPDQIEETVGLVHNFGGRAAAFTADVASLPEVNKAFQQIEEQLGPIDLLINNAGIAGPAGPIWEVDPEEWWHTLEINFRGAMLWSRYVLPGMLGRGRGRIIHVASDAGLFGIPYISAYGLSKTALIRLAETTSLETTGYGLSVFAISPGTVKTRFIDEILSSESLKWMPWLPEIFEHGLDVSPDLSVGLVLQLASGKYDALSGRFLTITDDLDELLASVDQITKDNLYTLGVGNFSTD